MTLSLGPAEHVPPVRKFSQNPDVRTGRPIDPAAPPTVHKRRGRPRATETPDLTSLSGPTPQIFEETEIPEDLDANTLDALAEIFLPREGGWLRDGMLGVVADSVDDLEIARIATTNRLRILTRNEPDADGKNRGFGLTLDHPQVARLALIAESLSQAEKDAIKALEQAMAKHPLGPWAKRTSGVGLKQLARLLAAIGDPAWNDLHNRPRTLGELYAYSGLHAVRPYPTPKKKTDDAVSVDSASRDDSVRNEDEVTPSSQEAQLLQAALAILDPESEETSSSGETPGTAEDDTIRVAPRRIRGQRANWSETARKRAWLIAAQCVKIANSPYRAVYQTGRDKYRDAVHRTPCHRCGPSGKPAAVGTPLSLGHQHARAIRLGAKAMLKDLWTEARRLHAEADAARQAEMPASNDVDGNSGAQESAADSVES